MYTNISSTSIAANAITTVLKSIFFVMLKGLMCPPFPISFSLYYYNELLKAKIIFVLYRTHFSFVLLKVRNVKITKFSCWILPFAKNP